MRAVRTFATRRRLRHRAGGARQFHCQDGGHLGALPLADRPRGLRPAAALGRAGRRQRLGVFGEPRDGGVRELDTEDARVIALGTGSAVVYYTYDEGGADAVRVVTTVGTDADGAAPPARFVSYLAPGQKAEVSVAGAVGTVPAAHPLPPAAVPAAGVVASPCQYVFTTPDIGAAGTPS